MPLHNEPHGLYCGAGHPLFTLPQNRIGEDEIGEALFSVRGYRYLDDLYRANHPRASASVLQMEAQTMMILSGRFIGFLPCHIADHWVAQNRMRRLRPDAYSFASHHFAAVRRSDRDHSLIAKFLKEARRSARPSRGEAVVDGVSVASGEERDGVAGDASLAMKER